jgi:hypothetical protein
MRERRRGTARTGSGSAPSARAGADILRRRGPRLRYRESRNRRPPQPHGEGLEKAADRAGLVRLTFHVLRDTFASVLIARGETRLRLAPTWPRRRRDHARLRPPRLGRLRPAVVGGVLARGAGDQARTHELALAVVEAPAPVLGGRAPASPQAGTRPASAAGWLRATTGLGCRSYRHLLDGCAWELFDDLKPTVEPGERKEARSGRAWRRRRVGRRCAARASATSASSPSFPAGRGCGGGGNGRHVDVPPNRWQAKRKSGDAAWPSRSQTPTRMPSEQRTIAARAVPDEPGGSRY